MVSTLYQNGVWLESVAGRCADGADGEAHQPALQLQYRSLRQRSFIPVQPSATGTLCFNGHLVRCKGSVQKLYWGHCG
jgi:hypothetical protein